MRRYLGAGLASLFVLTITGVVGCGSDDKAKVPDKTIELPKEGPVSVGGGGKPVKGKAGGEGSQ